MDSDHLTPAQLSHLATQIARQRDYLTRLRERMEALHFQPSDQLYSSVVRAWEAVSNLTVVAASKANRGQSQHLPSTPTIMERKPWAG